MSHSRWNLYPAVPQEFTDTCGYSRLVAQLLYNRGITEPSEVSAFLAAGEDLADDPNLLPGMQVAVARLFRALLSQEKIAVYGDFDADGITATALLVQGFSFLGCEAVPYIPNRLTEGYGLKTAALKTLKEQGISLVVTVDCGVTAVEEVRQAAKMGLDVIITDHHEPPEEIPQAVAVIDPKLPGSQFPTRELAGVGVALKLLQALFNGLGRSDSLDEVIDLVALGTVADMVPLLGENRYLVKRGLELLNANPRRGISEIISLTSLQASNLSSTSISWTIAPRLNAAGRLEDAMTSYKLLMTNSTEEARELASWLEQKNAERQKLTATTLEKAREQVLDQIDQPVLIASDPSFPAGIVGLVAGRLVEEFYRPVIIIKSAEPFSGGSCRSIPEFNIIDALNRCSHLLTHFGGHSRAAGLSLKTSDLAELKRAMRDIASVELKGVDLRPRTDIDAEVMFNGLTSETWSLIQTMAPFGQGNPVPMFMSRGVEVLMLNSMGSDNSHLRMKLRQGNTIFDAVGFGLGKYIDEVFSPLDIVFNLELDTWNGQSKLRLNIQDFEGRRR